MYVLPAKQIIYGLILFVFYNASSDNSIVVTLLFALKNLPLQITLSFIYKALLREYVFKPNNSFTLLLPIALKNSLSKEPLLLLAALKSGWRNSLFSASTTPKHSIGIPAFA